MDAQRRSIVEEIPRLRRYARSLLRDREAADDLVQDSLERALSRVESWTSGDSPRRWLFTIIHHLFVDQLRCAKRHVQAVAMMPETIDAVAAPPRQPDKIASMEVLSALQQINSERRAALTLVAVEGFSYADAANVLGIPAGTLMSRIARGREELRSILDDVSRQDDQSGCDKSAGAGRQNRQHSEEPRRSVGRRPAPASPTE
jgi:RNA polymerase sigma-70 factor (ECF subfamily)